MSRVLIAGFSCVVLLAAAGCQPGPLDDAVSRNDEEILHALLKLTCKLETREVISNLPATPRGLGTTDADPHNVQFGLDLAARPAHQARWPQGEICKGVSVVPDQRIEQAFAQETTTPPQWIAFGKAFGGAQHLLRVSLPVYSEDGRRAVVYVAGTCPFTCGAGFYHELHRTTTGWVITRSENAWIS